MRLVDYAKKLGVNYRTVWNWYHAGKLPNAYRTVTGMIIIPDEDLIQLRETTTIPNVAIYTRVSSSENKSNLDSQSQRLLDYCAAKGYRVQHIIKEVGSGLNDQRPKLLKLLVDTTVTKIVVEHKDRLTRFGFNYLEQLLKTQNRSIEVVNVDQSPRDDLMADFVAIITSFCARLYGQRRCKRKTELIVKALEEQQEVTK